MVKMGYTAEKQRMEHLEKQGYLCFRTSGSYGPIDIIAIKGNLSESVHHNIMNSFDVRLEQVKRITNSIKFHFDKISVSELLRCVEIEKVFQIPVYWVFKHTGMRGFYQFTAQQIEDNVQGKTLDITKGVRVD